MSRKALGRGLDALFTQVSSLDQDLVELDIDRLDPAEAQPRSRFNEAKLEELASSIRHNGVIQPLVVRRKADRFQIIAGERRWRAAQKAGLHRVPCIVKDVTDEHVLELSLIENIQREELNPIEEANAFRSLSERRSLTQDEIAQRVGKDRSTIANALRLLKLPAEIQRLLEEEKLSTGHARALLSVESIDQQIALADEIASKTMSVRETERLVKRTALAVKRRDPAVNAEAPNVAAAEAKLGKKLGAPVKIKIGKRGGTLEIKFASNDDLARLFDGLMQVRI